MNHRSQEHVKQSSTDLAALGGWSDPSNASLRKCFAAMGALRTVSRYQLAAVRTLPYGADWLQQPGR